MPDAINSLAPNSPNILNGITGFLSKATDTALDVYRIREEAKNSPTIGTALPSGQVNPDRLTAQPEVASANNAAQQALKYAPYMVYGGIALIAVIAVVMLTKGRK